MSKTPRTDAIANKPFASKSSIIALARELEMDLAGGTGLIAIERKRQIDDEGYTPAHDDEHVGGEIAQAAAALITCNWKTGRIPWPWDNGLKATDEVGNLIRAGALIAAEIDRLQRR